MKNENNAAKFSKEQYFLKWMMRKINKLQSHYGHPVVLNENGAHDLIHDEFASIQLPYKQVSVCLDQPCF